MPFTVAPPPRNGDAAQDGRPHETPEPPAADPAGTLAGAPKPPPTLPTPAVIARTVAAGVLLSAGALVVAAAPLLLLMALRIAFTGDVRLSFGAGAQILGVASLAIGYAAVLASPFWPWPARRLLTLGLATVVTAAWPLSGFPLLAAALASVAVGLALVLDHETPGGTRATSWGLGGALALVAALTALAAAALADARPEHPAAASVVQGQRGTPASGDHHSAGGKSKGDARHETGGGSGAPRKKTPATGGSGSEPREETPATGGSGSEPREETPATGGSGAAPREQTPPTGGGEAAPHNNGESPGRTGTVELPGSSDLPSSSGAPDTPTPAVSTDGAEDFIRAYYTAIDARRYDDAWSILPAGVRSQLGGFDRWTAALDKTRSNVPNDAVVSTRGDRVSIRLRLAVLEDGCPIARDYSVTWTLGHAAGEWTVAGLRTSVDGRSSCG